MSEDRMSKSDLIDAISEKLNDGETSRDKEISKAAIGRILNAEKEVIQEAVVAGKTVSLSGHVTFSPVVKAARKGHNPQTGEPIDIPERKGVKVKVSSTFNSLVND